MILKINEQISFLRKQKGITQEELAQALGVTNQSISKYESGACCPDIQLLPDIATFFGVSIDELLGYKPADTFTNVYLKIKSLFKETPKENVFNDAFRLCVLLLEAACTQGYKNYVPWDTNKNYGLENGGYKWGSSICSLPEGNTIHAGNVIFIANGKYYKTPTSSEIRGINLSLQRLCSKNMLKVMYGLYELTVNDFDLYVPLSEIAKKVKISESETVTALDEIPTTVKDTEDGQILYRIEGSYMHIPSLLLLFMDR